MSTEVKHDIEQEVSQDIVKETEVMSELETENIAAESTPEVDIEAVKKALEAREEELAKWQKKLAEKARELETESVQIRQKKLDLDEREKAIKDGLKREIEVERAEAKSKLSEEMEERRKKAHEDLDRDIDDLRVKQEAELKRAREDCENELQQQRENQQAKLEEERDSALRQLENEKAERTAELNRKESALSSEQARVQNENDKIEDREKDLEKKELDLLDQQRVLERDKRRLARERSRIEEDESNLTELVNQKIEDTIKTKEQIIESKNKELESLREQLATIVGEINSVKSFREAYGDDPQVLIQTIKQLENSNKQLRDKLSNSSDKTELDSLSTAYREAKAEVDRLLEQNRHLSDSQGRVSLLEAQFRTLDSEHKSLLATCESLENQLESKNQELVRLSTPEGRVADREARIAAIKAGVMDKKKDLIGAGEKDSRYNKKDEIAWLEDVWKKCDEYGIKFNKRILYAFHTALKINEWSTITVLAGVSGTGKSELPRLYSEFGGLNFCSVAVQPNWDSQESMLGFFNSIDNQFEPEELLKFLVQCTEDTEYNEYMSVILLDEMNLAHVEHYFAEFLSKLESRRGLSRNYLPEIEVKLGAGVKSYGLKLSRTLLWTGTMNQDETTKSLSDKVLDRGIVINFPRPKNLESRTKMGLITDYISDDRRPKLHKDTWQSWTSYTLGFSEEQKKEIENYRIIVQKINDALEAVGRALGHRVWQSIEYYIANYPTVRQAMNYQPKQNEKGKIVWAPTNSELTGELKEAMRTAFEDQIVQKIMPKLRGIETRDKRGKNSLDQIEDLLVNHDFASLQEDFQIAREQGYGQFIWNSAKYLEDKEEK